MTIRQHTTTRVRTLGAIFLGLSLWTGFATAATPETEASVARVGDVVITRAVLDASAAAEVLPLRLQVSEVYRAHLQRLVRDALFTQEAARRGVTVEQLIEQEVTAAIEEPTEEMLRAFYDEHQSELGAYGFEVVRSRLRQHLIEQAKSTRERVLIQDLENKSGVERSLEPFRMGVDSAGSASVGPDEAPITLVVFSDFECPYCARGAATIDALRERYGDTLKVVFRHFPLSFHVNGIPAAVAAECAREQGAFWAYHDRLFAHQDQLGNAELLQHANALDLKTKPFEKCMGAASHRERVEADVQAGAALGLSGAPAYFVNGRPVLGALPVDAFVDIIEEELR